jgi:hypothetical protein
MFSISLIKIREITLYAINLILILKNALNVLEPILYPEIFLIFVFAQMDFSKIQIVFVNVI